ncbi:MAG: hypothetical protein NC393_12965 [Clostridium sp.]|nr:hypothetical protein [Clostridium sp.]MCM1209620.1 hypothetical protein [Ruminococcus sp.]
MSIFEYDAELHMKMEREEDFAVISEMCKAAENFAPDYNEELVYEAYQKQCMTV